MFSPTTAKSCSDCPPPPAKSTIRTAKLISLIVTGLHTSRMSATGRKPSPLPPLPTCPPPANPPHPSVNVNDNHPIQQPTTPPTTPPQTPTHPPTTHPNPPPHTP